MAIAPAYYGIPTPLLVLGGLGATAGLIYVATRPRAPGAITAEPLVAPQYGVEVGPAVLEPAAPPPPAPPVVYQKPYRRIDPGAEQLVLRPNRYYRFRIDLPSDFNTIASLPPYRNRRVADIIRGLGFDPAATILLSEPSQLDPSWPPDAVAGGATFLTRWAQGYWTKESHAPVWPRELTNIWEY